MANGKSNGQKNGVNDFLSRNFWQRCEAVYYFLIILLVVLTFWLGAKFFNEAKDLARPDPSSPSVSVSGEGRVFVRPDIAVVSFSAFSESFDVVQAQNEAAAVINEAIKFLKDSGVAESDIKTLSYGIQPIYDFPKGRREFLGYQVRQTVEVKIRELNKTGSILSELGGFGVSEVSSLTCQVDDLESVQNEAREKAIADAKRKASLLASSLGVRLGQIVSFSESGFPPPVPVFRTFGAGAGFESSVPDIPTGENEITSSVNITFELK